MKKFALVLGVLLGSYFAFSQSGTYKYAPYFEIPTLKMGDTLQNAFGGGLNNPQFNELDVNFDCVKDLVIFDRSCWCVRVFLNNNISGEISYTYAPEFEKYFPEGLQNFVLLRDYNKDGKEDLFTYYSGGFRVYENVSDSVLKFNKITDYLESINNGMPSGVYVIPPDYPCIEDIDYDGDLDILSIHLYGTFVSFYENMSNNPDSMGFVRQDNCWGNFHENQLTDSIVLNSNCKSGGANPGSNGAARHAGATLSAIDIHGTGNKDLLMADMGYSNVVKLENGGTPTVANMISVDYHFPGEDSEEIDLPTFPATFFMDVDNNQRKDLIVVPNQRDGGADTGNVWLYNNYGANNNPNFQIETKNLLVGDQIDVGTRAYPVLADISGDGLADLIIGNLGYFDTLDFFTGLPNYVAQLAYYRNIGTQINPVFEFVTDDLAGLSSKKFIRMVPALADLDGDGDNDLLFGENNGSLSFYRNIAPLGQEADFVLVSDTFMGQFFGVQPSPFLYDVDGDNALDLLAGQQNGHIQLYLNQGDSSNPIYTLPVTDTLGGIFKYYPGEESNMIPFIGKPTPTSDPKLMVSDGVGNLLIYDGIASNFMSDFTLEDSLKLSKTAVAVSGAPFLNGDSLVLFVGERPGGVAVYAMDEAKYNFEPYPITPCVPDSGDTVGIIQIGNDKKGFELYPNPASNQVNIKLVSPIENSGLLELVDLTGRVVLTKQLNRSSDMEFTIALPEFVKGAYVIRLQVNNDMYYQKLIVK